MVSDTPKTTRVNWGLHVALLVAVLILHGEPFTQLVHAQTTGSNSSAPSNITTAPPSNMTRAPNATIPNVTKKVNGRNQTLTQTMSMSMTQSFTFRRNNASNITNRTRRTRTKTARRYTKTALPPTAAPPLSGDDLLSTYDTFVSMVLDIPSQVFDPDTFAFSILGPAIADKSFIPRVVLLDWCGVDPLKLPADWASSTCGSAFNDNFAATIARYTFSRAVGPTNYSFPNVDISKISKLRRTAGVGSGAEFYQIIAVIPPKFTDSPGLFQKAGDAAMSPAGIVLIVFIFIILIIVVVYIVRRVFMKSGKKKTQRVANYSVDPPVPGAPPSYDMADPAAKPGRSYEMESSAPPHYGSPPAPGAYQSTPPAPAAYGGGAGGRPSAYNSAPEPDERPSHQSREMDVGYY